MEIVDDRLRIVTGGTQIGSWPLASVSVERTSIYRFALEIEGDSLEFFPEEPSEFSNSVGAVIDLTEIQGRFGPKPRIQEASGA